MPCLANDNRAPSKFDLLADDTFAEADNLAIDSGAALHLHLHRSGQLGC